MGGERLEASKMHTMAMNTICTLSMNAMVFQMKQDEMDRTCGTHEKVEKRITIFRRKT